MSDKPVIFISHATTDNPIVDILKIEIERVFANGVEVFASSVPGVIKPGRQWLDEIKKNLEVAKAVIVLVTPTSINRPWIWFEVGASWSKMESGGRRIYPLCVPEIDFNELPAPLNGLQALSLGKAQNVKLFFEELCTEFGFGNLKGFKASTITSRLPKYKELKVSRIDIDAGKIYTGPYEGYSDEELSAIIKDNLILESRKLSSEITRFTPVFDYHDVSPSLLVDYLKSIRGFFTGQLIHFSDYDDKLRLPPGTSKRLLKDVVISNIMSLSIQDQLVAKLVTFNFREFVDEEFPNCIKFRLELTKQKQSTKQRSN